MYKRQVLDNDTDVDGDTLSVADASSDDGTVTINDDGTITFVADDGFTGDATITYTVSDPDGLTDEGSVTVTVGDGDPTRDGYVDGTAGDDMIDTAYTGDPDGDMIDNDDAILPGAEGDDDYVRAGDGDDTILAGDGDDIVEAGWGSDVVDGGEGDDMITTGNDDIAPDLGYPDSDSDSLGFDPDEFPDNDRDSVDGGAGNDTISTGDDRDTITGGTGDDVIDAGIDDDWVDGGDGDDILTGEAGDDSLFGGQGDDLLSGGADDDTLDGGDGADTFETDRDGGDVPIVTDFLQGTDTILIRHDGDVSPEISFEVDNDAQTTSILSGGTPIMQLQGITTLTMDDIQLRSVSDTDTDTDTDTTGDDTPAGTPDDLSLIHI